MQGKQLRKLEAELWRAADQLRANSKLTASEYSMPVREARDILLAKLMNGQIEV